MSGRANNTYDCPFHAKGAQRTPSFGIRTEADQKAGFWSCFSCKRGGHSIHELYAALTKTTTADAEEALGQEYENSNTLLLRLNSLGVDRFPKPFAREDMPADAVDIAGTAGEVYMVSRGFSTEFLAREGFKFVGADTSRRVMRNRVLFPVKDVVDGISGTHVFGFSSRSIDGGEPKYYRPIENCGNIFFNPGGVTPETSPYVVVVEGEMDTYRLLDEGLPAMGTFQALVTNARAAVLAAYETVYFAYDNDKAGHEGLEKAVKEYGEFINWRRCVYEGKDPGGLAPGFGKTFLEGAVQKLASFGSNVVVDRCDDTDFLFE
jgi:DNA primase